jgi:uncharacterized protein YcfL
MKTSHICSSSHLKGSPLYPYSGAKPVVGTQRATKTPKKIMNFITQFFLLPFAFCLLASCATEGPYVPAGRDESPEVENTTVIMDEEISKMIAVDEQHAERTPQGKLKSLSNVRNRTNKDLNIQVQTVFRDEGGFSIGDDTSWDTLVLTANETRTVSATSTTRKAARFTVRIRMVR